MSTVDWVASALSGYGRQLGFRNLALSEKGVAQFRFADLTALTFELRDEQLAIVLTRPVPYADGNQKRRALAAADTQTRGGSPLMSAWGQDDTLALISFLSTRDVTTPSLDSRVRELISTADWVVSG